MRMASRPVAGGVTLAVVLAGIAVAGDRDGVPRSGVRVELIDGENKPIQGFTMEDCEPFLGDEKFGPLRWKGGSVPQQDKVRVKFYISSGMLYGWMWDKG